jgi:hypothetical protein
VQVLLLPHATLVGLQLTVPFPEATVALTLNDMASKLTVVDWSAWMLFSVHVVAVPVAEQAPVQPLT